MSLCVWPWSSRLLLVLAVPTLQDTIQLDETELVEALQRGDETVFSAVMDWYSGSLLRLAMAYVPSRAVAEEVVQETWMGVLEGIGRFEGRSSFKTWLFRILTNRAKTRGTRERRYEPFGLPGTDSSTTRTGVLAQIFQDT